MPIFPRHYPPYIDTVLHEDVTEKPIIIAITMDYANVTNLLMKPKTLTVEVYTITHAARLLGYKSTKTLYRLINSGKLDEYIVESTSGRIFLQLEPQGCIPLGDKIRKSIQRRIYNVIKKNTPPKNLIPKEIKTYK